MKRWLALAIIVPYLGVLSYGLACQTIGFGVGSHPLMYYIVWDMFCGWTAYDSRALIIAEGESGKFYELAPAPWGELHPYGNLGRQHYDPINNHTSRIGLNVLKHTSHEPITRVFVIEETWAKKYNIPDPVWQARHDEPKDLQKYYHLRTVLLPDGTITERYGNWVSRQAWMTVIDNPRLKIQANLSRPMFVLSPNQAQRELPAYSAAVGDPQNSVAVPVAAPSGN